MEALDHQDADQPIGPSLASKTGDDKEFLDNCEVEYAVINGIPCYQQNHVIGGHVQIFERIGYDDRVGATFLGLSADGKELVVRVAPAGETAHVVHMEAGFLCKVEAATDGEDWRHFSQVHKLFATDDAYHLTLYFRGGPGLDECFGMRNKFSYGTAGRLANDVLNIIRCAHKHGYFLRNVDMGCFHYDAASRHLFQADISSLLKNVTSAENGGQIASYAGNLDYAPLVHHSGQSVGPRHDLESWFYQLLHMVWGDLPWSALAFAKVAGVKKALRESEEFKKLPEQFHKIAEIAFSPNLLSISAAEYARLSELTEQIYVELGGVTDYEENMDFEREPTPDEIPRLVMCRDDANPEEDDGEKTPTAATTPTNQEDGEE